MVPDHSVGMLDTLLPASVLMMTCPLALYNAERVIVTVSTNGTNFFDGSFNL